MEREKEVGEEEEEGEEDKELFPSRLQESRKVNWVLSLRSKLSGFHHSICLSLHLVNAMFSILF